MSLNGNITITLRTNTAITINVRGTLMNFRIMTLRPTRRNNPRIRTSMFGNISSTSRLTPIIRGPNMNVKPVTFVISTLIPIIRKNNTKLLLGNVRMKVFTKKLMRVPVRASGGSNTGNKSRTTTKGFNREDHIGR